MTERTVVQHNELNFQHWNHALHEACGQFSATEPLDHSMFLGHVLQHDWGGLPVSHIRTNAHKVQCHSVRNSTKTDFVDDTHCFLVVQYSGYARLSQSSVSFDMAPGDIAFMDAAYGCEIVPHGLMEHVSIHLDRRKVRDLLPIGLNRLAKLSRNSACGRLLHGLAGQICAEDLNQYICPGDGPALQDALIALLGQAMAQVNDAVSDAQAMQLASSLLERIKNLIDASLADPHLTPVKLAKRMEISLRQLYRLFEHENDSVCRYIQRTRLQSVAKDLGNPFMREKSLTDIAYAWGFSDSAHFSRSFKRQFELSPRDYRSQLQQAPATYLS